MVKQLFLVLERNYGLLLDGHSNRDLPFEFFIYSLLRFEDSPGDWAYLAG